MAWSLRKRPNFTLGYVWCRASKVASSTGREEGEDQPETLVFLVVLTSPSFSPGLRRTTSENDYAINYAITDTTPAQRELPR